MTLPFVSLSNNYKLALYNTECRKSHLTLQSTYYMSKHQGTHAPLCICQWLFTKCCIWYTRIIYEVYSVVNIILRYPVIPCSLVDSYQCYRESCCLHLQGRWARQAVKFEEWRYKETLLIKGFALHDKFWAQYTAARTNIVRSHRTDARNFWLFVARFMWAATNTG